MYDDRGVATDRDMVTVNEIAPLQRMPCQECDYRTSSVKDSRHTSGGWQRRRRVCDQCGHRWSTMEVPTEIVVAIPRLIERLRSMRDELAAMIGEAEEIKLPEVGDYGIES